MKTQYEKECDALRMLDRKFDEKSKEHQQAIHFTLMHTIEALVENDVVEWKL